jgi:hypothetical protein
LPRRKRRLMCGTRISMRRQENCGNSLVLSSRASLRRQLRLHQCRHKWDKHRSPHILGRAFQQSVFQNVFSLRRDTSGSSRRQRCSNQGSSEWSYCTSSSLSDCVPVSLCGQDEGNSSAVTPSPHDLDTGLRQTETRK